MSSHLNSDFVCIGFLVVQFCLNLLTNVKFIELFLNPPSHDLGSSN